MRDRGPMWSECGPRSVVRFVLRWLDDDRASGLTDAFRPRLPLDLARLHIGRTSALQNSDRHRSAGGNYPSAGLPLFRVSWDSVLFAWTMNRRLGKPAVMDLGKLSIAVPGVDDLTSRC